MKSLTNNPIIRTINLDDMRLFKLLADHQSFSGAARALNVSKQTISRRIAALEHRLGRDLIFRTTRSFKLTGDGAKYYAKCAEMLEIAIEAHTDPESTAHQTPRGHLRITADAFFAETFLVDLLDQFLKKNSQITLELIDTERFVDLADESFDIAFRIGALPDTASLSALSLGPARIVYCASPGYLAENGVPESVSDLSAHTCIGKTLDSHTHKWPFKSPAGMRQVPINTRIVVGSQRMVHELALRGQGIAILPAFAAAADIDAGDLVAVLAGFVADVGDVYIATLKRQRAPLAIEAFIGFARDWFTASKPFS